MVRVGENVLGVTIAGETSGMVAISMKDPAVGDTVLMVNTDSGNIAVRPFNIYTGDEGVSVPLPCGSQVFLSGEPPNYLPLNWENGFGMSCMQSAPETDGWICGSGCVINPASGYICNRYQSGGSVNRYNSGFCIHPSYSGIWRANKDNDWSYQVTYYTCHKSPIYDTRGRIIGYFKCSAVSTCISAYKTTFVTQSRYGGSSGGSSAPYGCTIPGNRVVSSGPTRYNSSGGAARDYWQCYGGSGGACPWYNYGRGTPSCQASPRPPTYSPGPNKPASCRYPSQLSFSGWDVGGGSQSASSGSCVLNKATEGAKNSSDDTIQCVFSR